MNIDLTTTIISSISSILVAFLALLAGRNDAGTISRKELRKAQIFNLLGPLDMLLSFSESRSPTELRNSIVTIAEENYNLLPEIVKNEIYILRTKDVLSWSDFDYLAETVSSLFNWTKKQVGYPYDGQKIIPKYRPSVQYFEKTTIVLMLILLAFSPFSMMIISVIFVDISVPDWLLRLYICLYLFVAIAMFIADFIGKHIER